MNFETVIGLEVHAQLKTNSKIFCGCSTRFGAPPNSNICPVCTGQPGVLPVLNVKAVEYLVKTGIALNCRVNSRSIFARKQYFYPDLPKNYQISQYELPLAEKGFLEIEVSGQRKKIGITRIHLEEDAGKLLHAIGSRELDYSLVDLNRTGVPLMEIVSEPDMRSPEEAAKYLETLKSVLEYLGVSDCDMEEGKFRCDANISVRPSGQKELGVKVELKNMNSISGVRDAIAYEASRQAEAVSGGVKVIQETRLWNADKKESSPMRTKEEAHDYRYFPEPDLVPLELDGKFIDKIRTTIPELPEKRKERFVKELGISEYDAGVLTADKQTADFFESALRSYQEMLDGKELPELADKISATKVLANWITVGLFGFLNAAKKTIAESPIPPNYLGILTYHFRKGTISGNIVKNKIIPKMFTTGKSPEEIIKEDGLVQIEDEGAISKLCEEAIKENPKAAEQYKAGKAHAIGALVGAVMKKSQGKANPSLVNKILKEKLS